MKNIINHTLNLTVCPVLLLSLTLPSSVAMASEDHLDNILRNIQEMAGQNSSSKEAEQARELVRGLSNTKVGPRHEYQNNRPSSTHRVEVREYKSEIDKRGSLPEATVKDIFNRQ